PGTLRAMLEARVTALAFEAHCTIILDREELVRLADTNAIPVVAIGPDGPGEFTGRSASEG
ncbi:MAG: UDP-2,3-diacylglucosamine diphosphatase LpxI, partial [Deltaproteobacteria bacterium]|nr:UDP-2,3-diacylglucosamine diphosphatase LpxI [Deltaproteobacteria bacterium]